MATSRSDVADAIKRTLSMDEVARYYGYVPNRAGYIKCPFHADKTASLRVYKEPGRGWHCFGCGAGSTVIDFTMALFDISFPAAVVRLNADFSLGLTSARPDPREVERRRREMAEQEAARARAEADLTMHTAQYRWAWEAARDKSPTDPGEPFDPEWAAAVRMLPVLEYWFATHPYPGGERY